MVVLGRRVCGRGLAVVRVCGVGELVIARSAEAFLFIVVCRLNDALESERFPAIANISFTQKENSVPRATFV